VVRTLVEKPDAEGEWPTGCFFSLPIVILAQLLVYSLHLPAIKENEPRLSNSLLYNVYKP